MLHNFDLEFININEIANFFIEMLKINPMSTISIIISFKLMLLFLDKIRYPRALDFLEAIIIPRHPETLLTIEQLETVWKHLRYTGFFEALGSQLLNGLSFTDNVSKQVGNLKGRTQAGSNPIDLQGSLKKENLFPVLTAGERKNHLFLEEKIPMMFDIDSIFQTSDKIKGEMVHSKVFTGMTGRHLCPLSPRLIKGMNRYNNLPAPNIRNSYSTPSKVKYGQSKIKPSVTPNIPSEKMKE
jgi:hypothetical protein